MSTLLLLGLLPACLPDDAPVAPGPPEVCSRCHLPPPADLFSQAGWVAQLRRKRALITQYALGAPLTDAEVQAATAWYTARAPQALGLPGVVQTPSPVAFTPLDFAEPPDWEGPPGPSLIGHVAVADLGEGPMILASDLQAGRVLQVRPDDQGVWREHSLARVSAPTRVEVVDFDADGDLDLLVADLGTLAPTDELAGQIVLVERTGDTWTPRVLATGLPRLCDVRPADVDGDGDLDVFAAAFGMFSGGGAGWLEVDGGTGTWHWLLRLNGTSHVPTLDLDADGRPDVVALVSQQHERLVALLNRGGGMFEPRVIFQAEHPMFGLSGVEAVDLDRDGDTDLLVANGDPLDDSGTAKPWHGVWWLENQGALAFEPHPLGRLLDASAVTSGDLDGDGDLDVVATGMGNLAAAQASVVWFENDGQQHFSRHPLDPTSPSSLVTVAVGDLDGDGRDDVVTGAMNAVPPLARIGRLAAWSTE